MIKKIYNKKIHTSNETFTFQRSGNFGGRKRRAIGNGLEDNEEVIFEVHILSLQIGFSFVLYLIHIIFGRCPVSWKVAMVL